VTIYANIESNQKCFDFGYANIGINFEERKIKLLMARQKC